MIDLSNSQNNSLIFKSISNNLSATTEMPSIESSILNQPKHLCIRLATGPQYYS